MNRQFENKTRLLIDEIQKSSFLSSDEKLDYESMLISACEGTNGISQEQKLQKVSESVYEIMQFLIVQRLNGNAGGKMSVVTGVVSECRWAIVSAIGIVSTLLLFQPQIAGVVSNLVR